MIYSTDLGYRWKLFEHYATRLMMGDRQFALTREEFADFNYLKIFFAPHYIQKKLKPWLPSIFDKAKKHERQPSSN